MPEDSRALKTRNDNKRCYTPTVDLVLIIMPGIVGCITRLPRYYAERELSQMVEALLHDNLCAAGVWADESLGVYVGWSERVGSFSGGMPLRNERGDMALAFSGEEFASRVPLGV